jgi:hypothetical protein
LSRARTRRCCASRPTRSSRRWGGRAGPRPMWTCSRSTRRSRRSRCSRCVIWTSPTRTSTSTSTSTSTCAISMGHPVAASGARVALHLALELGHRARAPGDGRSLANPRPADPPHYETPVDDRTALQRQEQAWVTRRARRHTSGTSRQDRWSRAARDAHRAGKHRPHRDHHPPPGVASSRCPKDHPDTADSRPRQCTPPGD